jgi:sterol desaturase/sphingolipid hydroxylase (fatty acid hydroxylase superfamily)
MRLKKLLLALFCFSPMLVLAQSDYYVEESYGEVFLKSFQEYAHYVWNEITFQVSPWYVNYFWWLIVLSLVVWGLEIIFPWRKNQAIFRKDFWLDTFYMFFNFYIFKLVIFMAVTGIANKAIGDVVGADLSRFALIDMSQYAWWIQLIIFFVATDFIQWITHILLHRFTFLWRFHQVHHSVEEMGFAAHLRFHWMENVIYSPMKYLMVVLIGGFQLELVFIAYYIAIAIGHLNHANIGWSYGPLKYIFNNPKMHIWHHAKDLPEEHKYGANFGISLSIWDYIFRTNYIPKDGRDIKLGFPMLDKFPKTFIGQMFYGFGNEKVEQEE